jgi:hypothetical protein
MDCPNCGLINPSSATRCDCGFDFVSRTIKESYVYPPGMDDRAKKIIRWHLAIMMVLVVLQMVLIATGPASSADAEIPLIVAAVTGVLVILLDVCVLRRSNAARVTLMIITFPVGLMLASSSVKLYCKAHPAGIPV